MEYKNYTVEEIPHLINNSALGDISETMYKYIAESVNAATSEDGFARDKLKICQLLLENLKSTHQGNWQCFFGTNLWYHITYQNYYAAVDFRNGDLLIIYNSP